MMRHQFSHTTFAACAALISLAACGDGRLEEAPESTPAPGSPEDPADLASGELAGETPASSGATSAGPNFGVSDERTSEVEVVCAAQSAASELRRVYLAFAFDVSGSMGNNPQTFALKWQPVVEATKGFFAEPDSASISASLTFFPGPNEGTRCTDSAYLIPDVPQTLLPSPAFAAAIDGLNLTANSQWRSSTPTLAAFNGVAASLLSLGDTSPDATYAVVMVTDGVPQQCGNSNDIQLVADAVQASGLQTFVVGVGNPPGGNGGGNGNGNGNAAGNNLDNLDVIARAGGTERAFVIETGDPGRTQADFKAVIDGIRGIALSCSIEIPLPPSGAQFVPEKVNVTYGSSASDEVRLAYDETCQSANGWRYDDPMAPSAIILCTDACSTVQRDASAKLAVEFGCERSGIVR
jgi:hypothetical protein